MLFDKEFRTIYTSHILYFSFSYRYGNPSRGIIGMSNRVILNGGLSALRWNRTTISEPANLNLASAGMLSNKNAKPNFLKTLPPKVSAEL